MNSPATPALLLAAEMNASQLMTSLQRIQKASETDPDLRRSSPIPQVLEALQDDRLSAIEVFARACGAYADRPMLGERAYALEASAEGVVLQHLSTFQTLTYKTAWERTVAFATGLARDRRTAIQPGEIVGICGFGSIDYVIADLACLYLGAVSAVLPLSLGAEELQQIAKAGEFAGIICARASAPTILAALPTCPSVRSVVIMDFHPEVTREAVELDQIRAHTALPLPTMQDLTAVGRASEALGPFIPKMGTDPLATLMYTSGSTGFPKGAMMTQSVWRAHWQLTSISIFLQFPSIGINFYPLSHVMGRTAVLRTLVMGGVMNFTLKSDMSTLFEDIRLTRPTFLYLVPRISEMIYQAYYVELLRGIKMGLTEREAQQQIFASLRSTFLGDRLVAAVIGSAPTSPEIMEFLTNCFEIPVFEAYGSTEAGVITLDGMVLRPLVSDYRLVDVPELGYLSSDHPHPRGELVVKTHLNIPGYYHNREATQALYDDEGYLRTGDIVEEVAPDQLLWVDRLNNVVKLAQGEFVTIWRLESLFAASSPFVDQIYIYANSKRAYLLAVVVPLESAVKEHFRLQGQDPTPASLRKLLLGEFNRIASEAELNAYEVPRDILVETERWTRENGLLTGINKPARPQLKAKYGQALEARYVQIEEQQHQGIAALDRGEEAGPLGPRLREAMGAFFGVPDLDLASGSFLDFGGDSISALTLATLLEQVSGSPVPVAELLNPGLSLQALADHIEAGYGQPGQQEQGGGPAFSDIHGEVASLIRSKDLRLEAFLSPGDLAEAPFVSSLPLPDASRIILLTGANGFLGHLLCLEWLERVGPLGGKVCCLLRGSDEAAAFGRLREAFRTGDAALERRFETLAAQHLEVVAGDFAAPLLGLPPLVYERLAGEVDLIVHAGALVNHVFSYEQLFAPNVAGTAQLIRLALHQRPKRIDYVSTVAVVEGARVPGKVSEASGVDALLADWPATGGYAHGYATSKWASEVLLKAFHERFGLPVRVFRADMILPHRRYRGQVNVPDMLTRLLISVIWTGLAPRSFYVQGLGSKAHFDGLPVDFVAASMVALSSGTQVGHTTYQVSNAHWQDGISLDTLMDWVESAGYSLERITEYSEWYRAFSDKLAALPATERLHSSLPILHQWATPSANRESERIDATQFTQQVERHHPGGELSIPHLSEPYIHKYLADLQALGLLKAPLR